MVHSREFNLLDGAGSHRARQGIVARGDRVRPHRERGMRAARPDLRALLHRPEARLAVLGLAQIVYPVLVHPGRRDRVPDDLRAVRLPLCDDAAANRDVGRVRRLRAPGSRRHRHVLHWDRARSVAHILDLLWAGRAGNRSRPATRDPDAVLKEKAMSKRLPERYREPELMRWTDVPGLAFAFGIALLIGLVSGVIWIAWKLFEVHVLRGARYESDCSRHPGKVAGWRQAPVRRALWLGSGNEHVPENRCRSPRLG